jgi:2-(1,2-epoxy-1,2-dihydrophenyl)acetyl-CoA isomerase
VLNHSAINPEVARGLFDAAIDFDERDDVRALLLSSSGRFFCAGGDLAYFAGLGEGIGAALKDLTATLHAAISRLYRMRKPLVIAVNGAAAGAGMSLAVMGDFVVAARSASFTMAYTGIGFSPDGSSSYFLPRLLGERRARELMITNRVLKAPEALEWGLVSQVVEDAELPAAALARAGELARGPTRAYGSVKTLLAASWHQSLETQMALEADLIAANAASADGREGLAAFLAKRKPAFTGR